MAELLYDDDFGLSDDDTSEDEGGEVYCYHGEDSLDRETVEELGRQLDLEADSSSALQQVQSSSDSNEELVDFATRGKFS